MGRRELGRDNRSILGQVKTQSWPVRSVVFPRGEASTSLHNRRSTRRSERLRPGNPSRSWPPITDMDLRTGTDRSRYVIGPGLGRRAQSGQVRRWSSALRRPGPFIIGRTGRPGSGLRSVSDGTVACGRPGAGSRNPACLARRRAWSGSSSRAAWLCGLVPSRRDIKTSRRSNRSPLSSRAIPALSPRRRGCARLPDYRYPDVTARRGEGRRRCSGPAATQARP